MVIMALVEVKKVSIEMQKSTVAAARPRMKVAVKKQKECRKSSGARTELIKNLACFLGISRPLAAIFVSFFLLMTHSGSNGAR